MLIVVGTVFCIVGCLALSFASTVKMPPLVVPFRIVFLFALCPLAQEGLHLVESEEAGVVSLEGMKERCVKEFHENSLNFLQKAEESSVGKYRKEIGCLRLKESEALQELMIPFEGR